MTDLDYARTMIGHYRSEGNYEAVRRWEYYEVQVEKRQRDQDIERLRAVIDELLPYARASIGLPENAWSPDNVILKARAIMAETKAQ